MVQVGRDWYVGLDPCAAKLNQVVCSAAGIQIISRQKPSLTYLEGYEMLLNSRNEQQALDMQATPADKQPDKQMFAAAVPKPKKNLKRSRQLVSIWVMFPLQQVVNLKHPLDGRTG